jgi:hypothetical protein
MHRRNSRPPTRGVVPSMRRAAADDQQAAADGRSHVSLARRGMLSTWHTMAARAHPRVAPKIRQLFVD